MAVLDRIPDLYYPTMLQDVIDTLRGNGGTIPDTNIDGKNLTPLLGCFQAAANINIWSKRKPIYDSRIGVLTTEEMAVRGGGASDATKKYGLTIAGGKAWSPKFIYQAVKSLMRGYGVAYTLPEGGQASPFRLSDFNGYYPAATAPITGVFVGDVELTPPSNNFSDGIPINFYIKGLVADGEIAFEDLYATKDEDGNALTWKGCLYVVDDNGGAESVLYDEILAQWQRMNKGKTFTAMQFISTTTQTNLSLEAVNWATSWQYALPLRLFKLTIKDTDTGDGGNTGVQNNLIIDFNTVKFQGITTDPYGMVYGKFTITKYGGTGAVSNFTAGIYTDAACSLDKRVAFKAFDNQTINTSKSFTARLDNPERISTLWFGVYFNGNLQARTAVAMPIDQIIPPSVANLVQNE